MAFPVVESTATTGRTAAETTSPVTFPATISPGALIVCLVRVAVAGVIGWPVDWVELVEDSSDASDDVSAIAYFTAVGNEDGTTFNVTHGNGKSSYIVYSITGAEVPATQAPQISAVTVGTSATPDPAVLTPTGGAKDYLWVWLGGWEGEQTSPPAANPTNYTIPLGASTGTGGVIATNCRVASAQRNLNAASEDPGSWTISASDDWTAWTMAVHPTSTQTFSQTLTATAVTSTTTRQLQANKIVTASVVASTATLAKQMASTLTATIVSAVATMTRGLTLGRTLTSTAVTHVASMTRGLSFGRTLTTTVVTNVAMMARGLSFGRTLSAISSAVAKLGRDRSHGLPFLFTAANWGTVSFFLEVFLRATSGTVRARLYNETDGAVVTGSELSTTSGSYVRLRSTALTLIDGKTYAVQFGIDDANSGAFRGARIIVL